MKVFGKSSSISRAYFAPFITSKYKHTTKKGSSSSYLTNTVYEAVSGDPSIIQLSDGTYKQRSQSHKSANRKKKNGSSLQKVFGKLARKTKPSSSAAAASADKVLEAVTIQYPGFATGEGGVELDLSFGTTATIDFSEEHKLDALAELGIDDDEQQTPDHSSTSLLNRIFPSVFDEEGFIKCLCSPEDPVSLTTEETIPNKTGSESNDSTTEAATGDQSNGTTGTSTDASPGTATDVKDDSCVPIENVARMWLADSDGKCRANKIAADNSKEANQEASKKEADQLALIELYRSENHRLKQDLERLSDLWPRFHAEYEHLKLEAARLKQEVALLKQEKYERFIAEASRLKQEMDAADDPTQNTKKVEEGPSDEVEEDVFGDLKKSQLENELDRIINIRDDLGREVIIEEVRKTDDSTESVIWTENVEENTISGMFLKVANMFEDDGFIKCV